MRKKIEYYKGEKVGEAFYLYELEPTGKQKYRRAMFQCRCGKEFESLIDPVKRRNTNSCGCYHAEIMRTRARNKGTHNMSYSTEYKIWLGMNQRCHNAQDRQYPHYGGRGITVCDQWRESFENFLEDMGYRPSKDYSIDRTDNDKGYSKENCGWKTRSEQARNRRSNRLITFNNSTKCVSEWAEVLKLDVHTLQSRIRSGWTIEKALTTPARERKKVA